MIARLRRHPLAGLAAATAIAAGALALVSWAAGFGKVGHAFASFSPGWIALVVAGQALGLGGYTLAYHAAAQARRGPCLSWARSGELVAAGFAPFAPRGGFGVDREALQSLAARPHVDRPHVVRVLGLGALEYALLAPAAWICALIGLSMAPRIPLGFSLPWAICVPIGFGLALWAARPQRRRRIEQGGDGRSRRWLATGLRGVDVLRELLQGGAGLRLAYLGMAVYWAGDIASFYGALRCVSGHIGFIALVLAYASGYAATRRTLPYAGVGVTEAMLAYFTHLMHVGFGIAIAAVAVYRLANLVLPALPALRVWPRVVPLVERRDQARRHARRADTRPHGA